MSDFTFNVSLGREVELYSRVDNTDPTDARLRMMVLAATGLESDAALKDYDTFAAILAGTTNEVTNTNYARKVLAAADITAYTVDDNNDRIVLACPTQTFTNIAAGDSWSKAVIGYSAVAAPTDSQIVPITAHDLRYSGAPVIPNGTNIVIAFANGFVVCD